MTSDLPRRRFCILFASTVFVSAFLLFQVQPLISKFILPWFGGSPAVWSTCMLFFQVTLFVGYVYAHLTSRYLPPRGQAILHIALLILATFLLPIAPDDSWKPNGNGEPILQIVTLLTVCVGLPYFILSSTGPLLQRWFSLQAPGTSPYRLYSLSNIGSLLALVSYPFLVEPTISSPTQAWSWSVVFGLFAVLCACCACGLFRMSASPTGDSVTEETSTDTHPPPTWLNRATWFGLAMVASVMLLATTNQVCLDVATIPFLWIAPLTIYLASFILCFDTSRWYSPRPYSVLLIIALLFVVRMMINGAGVSIILQVPIYLSALYLCCMVCHGELAAKKPHPQHLTQFYLLMSAGGAGGGVLVGLIAPYVFPAYWELHFGIIACLVVSLVVFFRERSAANPSTAKTARFQPGILVWPAVLVWVVGSLFSHARDTSRSALDVARNFYGVLRVVDQDDENGTAQRELFHGRICHGSQLLAEENRGVPTTYYGRTSGSGLAMQFHKPHGPRRIGVVGMGIGTLAAYGSRGDTMRFYEINPEVIRMAQSHFTFLKDTPADCELVLGDGRLSLEHEPPQDYDVLILDAFSGDAIPTHLLTREAFGLYDNHLKSDGVLCVHISNLHFDLRPIIHGLATEFGWETLGVQSKGNVAEGTCLSQWILLSRNPISPEIVVAAEEVFAVNRRSLLWTDEWSNLISVLR